MDLGVSVCQQSIPYPIPILSPFLVISSQFILQDIFSCVFLQEQYTQNNNVLLLLTQLKSAILWIKHQDLGSLRMAHQATVMYVLLC